MVKGYAKSFHVPANRPSTGTHTQSNLGILKLAEALCRTIGGLLLSQGGKPYVRGLRAVFVPFHRFLSGTACACFLALFALNSGAVCLAQIPSESDVTSTPVPNSGHDYIQGFSETVNPANGSLSIRIGVPIPPSRGFTVPFNFAYDSNGVFFLTCLGSNPCGNKLAWNTMSGRLSQGGWSYSAPTLSVQSSPYTVTTEGPTDIPGIMQCGAFTNFVMQDMNGNRHNLGLSYSSDNPYCTPTAPPQVTSAEVGPLLSTTTATWVGGTSPTESLGTVNPVTVADSDGTVYSFGGGTTPPVGPCAYPCVPTVYPAYAITDRNGNSFSITSIPGVPSVGGQALRYTDTIGRTALNIPTFGGSPDTVTVSGLNTNYQVSWTTVTPSFSITMTSVNGSSTCTAPGAQPTISVVSAITLPNNEQYTFTYDPTYGMVSKITYPTGGYVRYVWGLNTQAEYGSWPLYISQAVPDGESIVDIPQQNGFCDYHYDTPAILQRYVSFNGSTEVEEQDFSYSTAWQAAPTAYDFSQKATTVITRDLVL